MAINPKVSTLGRIMMVDPNPEGNGTVNLEDLSIIVELDTESKGRSVVNIDSNKVFNTSSDINKTTVKFIDGPTVGDHKNLTTNYTEINTTFNKKGKNLETLGITNIDIAFNSSYAPMIKIDFIDIRGNSIFERGNESDYRVFFDLPYPIFKLTIKGYYGKAVTYCLHLTKWNSLFNSETGNYEISCEFVGYTYAVLTDMLIGYLKGIGETQRGRTKLGRYKLPDGTGVSDEDGNVRIPTILELLQIISRVNKEVKKIKANNNDVKQLAKANEVSKDVEKVRDVLDSFIDSINPNGGGKNITDDGIKGIVVIPVSNNTVLKNQLESHKKNITNLIENTNKKLSETFKLNITEFDTIPVYKNVSIFDLKSYPLVNFNSGTKKVSTKDDRLLNILSSNLSVSDFAEKTPLNVIDLRKSYLAIKNSTDKLEKLIVSQKDNVSETLKNEIPKIIGFKPTIANMLAIFTAHAEVLLEVIKDVAQETTKDSERTKKLTSFETSDIPENVSENTSGNPSGDIRGEIFPFPEFTTKDGIEVWVGDDVTIPETEFIEELLRGLLRYSKSEEKILNLLSQNEQGWYSINPLDTLLGGSFENPYTSSEVSNTNDVNVALRLVAQRAITYLGYTTSDYAGYEIRTMARLEANNLYNSLENDITKDTFANTFLNGSDLGVAISGTTSRNKLNGLNNNKDNPFGTMLVKSTKDGYLSYNYIHKTDVNEGIKRPKSYINITAPFNGNNFLIDGSVAKQNRIASINTGNTYISNYANDGGLNKVDDGATYIKLVNTNQYLNNNSVYPVYESAFSGDSAAFNALGQLDLNFLEESDLKATNQRGDRYLKYNQFTSSHKTQDFTKIVYNNNDYSVVGDTPKSSLLLFYADSLYHNGNTENYKLGLVNYDFRKQSEYDLEIYKIGTPQYLSANPSLLTNFDNLGRKGYLQTYTKVNEEQAKLKKILFGDEIGQNIKYLDNIIEGNSDGIYMPFIDYYTMSNINDFSSNRTPYQISLFGSEFYYEQTSEEAKAFLFLHTLPFNGIMNNLDGDKFSGLLFRPDSGLLGDIRLLNLFKRRGGIVNAPKPWVAFIGGLLWRSLQSTDPITFRIPGTNEILIAALEDTETSLPNQFQYLRIDELGVPSMCFGAGDDYTNIESVFINFPIQVKNLFINEFFDFVKGENNFSGIGWPDIKRDLEIIDTDNINPTRTILRSTYNDFLSGSSINQKLTNKTGLENYRLNGVPVLKNIDNFNIVNKYTNNPRGLIADDETVQFNIFLEHKADTASMDSILTLLTDPITIINSTWRIWDNKNNDSSEGNQIFSPNGTNIEVNASDLSSYFNAFQEEFIKLNINDINQRKKEDDARKSELFNSIDNDKIKLNLYRNIKAVYDKWVAGTSDVLSHCGGGNIKPNQDFDNVGGKLINSFHFLTKSFTDIGDKFFINPLGVINNISGNFNQNLYDLISRTLSDNNFNFVPLPSFINYKIPDQVEDMFKPYPYSSSISASTVGPSFVCTYIGQRSKHLDLGNESLYNNDGFDFKTNGGGVEVDAKGFSELATSEKDLSIPVFAVNYGDQNQSIFKDIKLNQQEYSETDETLQIMDDISKGGNPNSRTYMGQNLFNVYSTRSYTADIEMLGNAMVQPMMYFQLNSIPMFHGAFLITNVKHKIIPNHMTTTFTGVRVRKQDLPLLDEKTVYMNFVDIVEDVQTDGVSLSPTVGVPEWNYNKNVTKIIKS